MLYRLDSDAVVSGAELIEHQIVMSNDLRCAQNAVVSGEVRITRERDVVADAGGVPTRRIHTVLCHRAGNDQVGYISLLEFSLQVCPPKRIRGLFSNHKLASLRLQCGVELPSSRVGFERMPFSAIVLDVNHRKARGSGFSYQLADAWQDAVLHRSGHELHQALLYINDQERGVACLSIASHVVHCNRAYLG